jgi:hypothetical protein
MSIPLVNTRMEQPGQLSRLGIDPSDVRTFVSVAVHTGKGKVVEAVCAAMLFRDDVVDLERRRMK